MKRWRMWSKLSGDECKRPERGKGPMLKKGAVLWVIGLVVGFYTTFVLQNLWNWFVTVAFNLPQISFWVMFGIVLMIGMFDKDTTEDEIRFKALSTVVEACVPFEKQDEVNHELKLQGDGIWFTVGTTIFGKILVNTLTLAAGFAVHLILV